MPSPSNESHWQKVGRLLANDVSSAAGTVKDIVGRGVVAPILGFPMDMFNLGARRPEHKGSSEFFGEQMEDAGIVSPDRNYKSELLASLLNPASFAAKAAAIPALAATFAGKGAKGANLSKLFEAKEMLKKGGSDRDAYAQTGWTHGFADKKPRFEIDDTGSKGNFTHLVQSGNRRLSDKAIDHPTLYDEYPELNKYTQLGLKQDRTQGSLQNSYVIDGQFGERVQPNMLEAKGRNVDEVRSVGLHELQHGVQTREGHALGGNVKQFRLPQEEAANSIYDAQKKLDMLEGWQRDWKKEPSVNFSEIITTTEKDILDQREILENLRKQANIDPYKSYRKLAGEAEARLTQARMNMTAAERAKSYPPDMFDVPVKDQIVKYK